MFSQVSLGRSVHNRPHGYSVLAHPCYTVVGTHPTGMLSCLTCFSGIYLIMICLNVKNHKPKVIFLPPLIFYGPSLNLDQLGQYKTMLFTDQHGSSS